MDAFIQDKEQSKGVFSHHWKPEQCCQKFGKGGVFDQRKYRDYFSVVEFICMLDI
jgi:hypothetical protein